MRCDEAQQFVSAMYDDEGAPLEAAEHTAYCADCQELLKGYAEMGATLRSYGSLLTAQPIPGRTWLSTGEDRNQWWEKGLQMMRLPKIAFASLILLLVVLGSRLALVEVRAHDEGSVLLLKLTPVQGDSIQCHVSVADANRNHCGGLAQIDGSNLLFGIKALRRDGDRVLLSIRSTITPIGPASYGLDTDGSLPETQSWFTPGKSLSLPGTGELKLTLTGEWADHIPVTLGSNPLLDPGPNEIRLTTPLLLKNKKVVGDMFASADADKPGEGVFLYIPGEGRFILSSTPVQGSIQARAQLNRVSFESNGQMYIIVTGMPISRADNMWVVHDVAYKPSPKMGKGAFLGAGLVSELH